MSTPTPARLIVFAIFTITNSALADDAPGDTGSTPASLLARFDANKDGGLDRNEAPPWLARPFARVDGDGDGKLSLAELERVADRLAAAERAGDDRAAPATRPATRPAGDAPLPLRQSTTPAARGERYPENLKVGDAAPDFTLPPPCAGDRQTLSKLYAKRPVVLVFGSYTCPPFRRQVLEVEQLYQAYKDRVDFLLVYIREAHPGSVLPVLKDKLEVLEKIEQTEIVKDRSEHAEICQSMLGLTFPAVVDLPDNKVNAAYSAWPIRLAAIGTDGKIKYMSGPGPGGFRPAELKAWLVENAK